MSSSKIKSMINILKFNKENESFQRINNLYDDIYSENKSEIFINNHKFNNFIGDITKNIIWTWAINDKSFNTFIEFFEKINLVNNLNKIYDNQFDVSGISYITLNTDEISDKDSLFHYDIVSQYDLPNTTNILTVLIPMKYECGMGGLEYIFNNEKHIYNYIIGEYIVFDSSKIEHRTLPFKLNNKKSRVLISVNLSSDLDWAKRVTNKITSSQGNLYQAK